MEGKRDLSESGKGPSLVFEKAGGDGAFMRTEIPLLGEYWVLALVAVRFKRF